LEKAVTAFSGKTYVTKAKPFGFLQQQQKK
jgi:hypothetical protein